MPEFEPDIARADRLSRKRARLFPIIAVLFFAQQGSYFARTTKGAVSVPEIRIGAWVVLAILMIALLAFGGTLFASREVRALMDDEVTRANRAAAMTAGFLAACMVGIALYPFADILSLTVRETLHLVVSSGIVAAMVRFGMLERRALG